AGRPWALAPILFFGCVLSKITVSSSDDTGGVTAGTGGATSDTGGGGAGGSDVGTTMESVGGEGGAGGDTSGSGGGAGTGMGDDGGSFEAGSGSACTPPRIENPKCASCEAAYCSREKKCSDYPTALDQMLCSAVLTCIRSTDCIAGSA